MDIIYLYTIWEKVEDFIVNPLLTEDIDLAEPDQESFVLNGKEHPLYVIDPNNPSGVRYQALKVVHDITVARAVCDSQDGKYVYTIGEAFFGNQYGE